MTEPWYTRMYHFLIGEPVPPPEIPPPIVPPTPRVMEQIVVEPEPLTKGPRRRIMPLRKLRKRRKE